MKPIRFAMNLASQVVDFVARHSHQALRDARNVDICLSTLCKPESLAQIRFPVAYIEFLRTCIEQTHCAIKEVKRERRTDDNSDRFSVLLKVLSSSLPPIEFSVAAAIGLVADHYRTLRRPLGFEDWASDIGLHFQVASSFGKKGRILSAIIRLAKAERCLELGTGYGMSALFILEALRTNRRTGHLKTLEGFEPQYSLSSSMLKQRYSEMVSCHFGNIQDELGELARAAAPIDFMFHDAGHSREDYIRDFNAAKDSLAAGAVVLIDDIRWEAIAISNGQRPRCYEGWAEICADPRVRRAAEIDHSLGLLLLR